MKLLSEEEIALIASGVKMSVFYQLRNLCQAQLDKAEPLIKQDERERILRLLFRELYPAHLKAWADKIEQKQKYENILTATLRHIAAEWQALKEEKNVKS